ncbi:hypothetical protein HPC49_44185, partial [Pyxidicoccus fallax]|nr:hypothetical protein [Pyxidicoccus fallax]
MHFRPGPLASARFGRLSPCFSLLLALVAAACGGEGRQGDRSPSQARLEADVTTGAVGMGLRFRCSALNPDGGALTYGFDWGDGSEATEPLTEAVASGTPVEVEHAFTQKGQHRVRCRGVDAAGRAGPWSEPVEVHVRALASGPLLTVALEGEGSVRSVPDGISCGATCEAGYPERSWVGLEATPAHGWRFSRWEGDCEGEGTQSQVYLHTDVRCVARFERRPASFTLQVEVMGAGDVHSTPALLACPGAACEVRFPDNDEVTLSAVPRSGWRFNRWSGDCADAGAEVRRPIIKDLRCTAHFLPEMNLVLDRTRVGASSPSVLAWSPDGSLLAAAAVEGETLL